MRLWLVLVLLMNTALYAQEDILQDKIIVIDPGHGGTAGTDDFRIGPGGEREEWINLRVAKILQRLLKRAGANPMMTRQKDVQVDLKARAELAIENQADLFISIHHNATADPEVNFPIIYFHGNASENEASVAFGRVLGKQIRTALFDYSTPVSLVSDHTIFPKAGTAVLRHSYEIPGVISEASFFTNPDEEGRLKKRAYNRKEAKAIFTAIEYYFNHSPKQVAPYQSQVSVKPFEVFQEEERMNPEARNWYQNFLHGLELLTSTSDDDLMKAYQLFETSARSFPDSYVAAQCQFAMAEIQEKLGNDQQAEEIQQRVEEFYVTVP